MVRTAKRIDSTDACDTSRYSIAIIEVPNLSLVSVDIGNRQPSATLTIGFFTRDPIGFYSGDVNFYQFILSRPVTLRDPQGYKAVGFKDDAGKNCGGGETCFVAICSHCGDKSVAAQVIGGGPLSTIDPGHTAICWSCNSNYPGPILPKTPPFNGMGPPPPGGGWHNKGCSGLYPQDPQVYNGGKPGQMHPDFQDFKDKWNNGELSCRGWTVCPDTLVAILKPAVSPLPEYAVVPHYSQTDPIVPMPDGGCENCTTFACKQLCAGGIKFPIYTEPFQVCHHPLCVKK